MTNVTPIGKCGVTPEVIAEHIRNDASQIDEIYVIAFDKEGRVIRYISGSASGMALAALVLADDAKRLSFERS